MVPYRAFGAFLLFLGIAFSVQMLEGQVPVAPAFDGFAPAVTQEDTAQKQPNLLGCVLSEDQSCFHCCHGGAHHTSFLGAASVPVPVNVRQASVSFLRNVSLETNIFPVDHQPPKALS